MEVHAGRRSQALARLRPRPSRARSRAAGARSIPTGRSTPARAGARRRSGASSASRRSCRRPSSAAGSSTPSRSAAGSATPCARSTSSPAASCSRRGPSGTSSAASTPASSCTGRTPTSPSAPAALGYRPAITPDAVVTHEIGVSSATREDKLLLLFRGKATLLRKHWRGLRLRAGLVLLNGGRRRSARCSPCSVGVARGAPEHGRQVWRERRDWLPGYRPRPDAPGASAPPPRRARPAPLDERARALVPRLAQVGLRHELGRPGVLVRLHDPARSHPRSARLRRSSRSRSSTSRSSSSSSKAGCRPRVVQREDLEDDHLDSAFWVNLVWCVAARGRELPALAGWWARLNGVPELEHVVQGPLDPARDLRAHDRPARALPA